MSLKIPPSPEAKEKSPNQPSLLDLVNINGRWAQVRPSADSVVFLTELINGTMDFKDKKEIIWNDYNFEPCRGTTAGDLLKQGRLTREEYEAVHWGEDNPALKKLVKVFGQYTSKKISNPA